MNNTAVIDQEYIIMMLYYPTVPGGKVTCFTFDIIL